MRYSVAVKRKFRDTIPADWMERLASCEGLQLEGGSEGLAPQFGRLMIEANAQALKEVQSTLGEMLHIEPVITHDTSEEAKSSDESEETVESPWAPRS